MVHRNDVGYLSVRHRFDVSTTDSSLDAVETRLNAVVVAVSYDELTNAVHGDPGEAVELALSVAVAAELLDEDALRVKHLENSAGPLPLRPLSLSGSRHTSHPSACLSTWTLDCVLSLELRTQDPGPT